MNVPSSFDKRWEAAILVDKSYNFKFLATKILLARLKINFNKIKTAQEMKKSIDELQTFFKKNINNPLVANDLSELLGGM
ncbi:hypothetical protein JW960_02550 [candidate division KSB1 bacterium]|nr:hypothetical protein [candidate division KSB1 bacterium]